MRRVPALRWRSRARPRHARPRRVARRCARPRAGTLSLAWKPVYEGAGRWAHQPQVSTAAKSRGRAASHGPLRLSSPSFHWPAAHPPLPLRLISILFCTGPLDPCFWSAMSWSHRYCCEVDATGLTFVFLASDSEPVGPPADLRGLQPGRGRLLRHLHHPVPRPGDAADQVRHPVRDPSTLPLLSRSLALSLSLSLSLFPARDPDDTASCACTLHGGSRYPADCMHAQHCGNVACPTSRFPARPLGCVPPPHPGRPPRMGRGGGSCGKRGAGSVGARTYLAPPRPPSAAEAPTPAFSRTCCRLHELPGLARILALCTFREAMMDGDATTGMDDADGWNREQVVHGLAALPRVVDRPARPAHLRPPPGVGSAPALHGRVLWLHRADARLCVQGASRDTSHSPISGARLPDRLVSSPYPSSFPSLLRPPSSPHLTLLLGTPRSAVP